MAAAALSDGDLVNFSNIGRDCATSGKTVKSYFDILEDTLLGRWLPAYRKRPKRRVIGAPKFYFADVGVVNHLAKRGVPERGSDAYGQAFENWVHHELTSFRAYSESNATLAYWRLASGIEVDFVVDDVAVAIEAKAVKRVTGTHLKGLRSIAADHPRVGKRVIVCLESRRRQLDEGILVLPAKAFVRDLWAGEIF